MELIVIDIERGKMHPYKAKFLQRCHLLLRQAKWCGAMYLLLIIASTITPFIEAHHWTFGDPDGLIHCAGSNVEGQQGLSNMTETFWKYVASGYDSTCGLDEDDNAVCVGGEVSSRVNGKAGRLLRIFFHLLCRGRRCLCFQHRHSQG